MHRHGKIDANQNEIVAALRQIPSCSVAITSMLGHGFPDLVVGFRGKNYLLEVKDGQKVLSAQNLTPDESKWHFGWFGQVATVKSVDDALRAIGLPVPSVKMQPGESYKLAA